MPYFILFIGTLKMIESVMMNANNPQTPGVYTVEKNAFPNSVAQVPTAIPAFLGYTEKAVLNGKPLEKPLLINSMSEYEQHFGGPPINLYPIVEVMAIPGPSGKKIIPSHDVKINGQYYQVQNPTAGHLFYLYYCLQLFYQNGGGPCYIASIGNYEHEVMDQETKEYNPTPTVANKNDFLNKLELLPKIPFPKPTMILAPDSLLLNSNDYYMVQEQILMQCGELGDRVALIDVYDGFKGLEQGVISNHRNSIGNKFLKFGISYYPFLETTIVGPEDMTYANVDQNSKINNAKKLTDIFIGESALIGLGHITKDLKDVTKLTATPKMVFDQPLSTIPSPSTKKNPAIAYPSWRVAYNAFSSSDSPSQILKWQMSVVFTMAWMLYELGQGTLADPVTIDPKTKKMGAKFFVNDGNLKTAITKLTGSQSMIVSQLISLSGFDSKFTILKDGKPTITPLGIITKAQLKKLMGLTDDDFPKSIPNPYDGMTNGFFNFAQGKIKSVFIILNKAIASIHSAANSLLHQYNGTLEANNPNYKKLMEAIAKHAGTLPPSAAMAGVYTLVDNTEGVWMSPANRNINSVIAPTVHIDNAQQASLNVDAIAGKSINAIRSFYGRGPAIIWGARTLDGNSMDWRYVNIRRTMIMIEQSVANAAQQLVFQSNDASTWSTCESMISNFLNNLWNAGALQGAASADAYQVEIGLGKTMTPIDILNGIMRIQVKLAIVHPAEFIIITYEQEMAKS